MDEYKHLNIKKEKTGKIYTVHVLIKDHALERLKQRKTKDDAEIKINKCIEKAADKIINDYPDILSGEYIIRSLSTGLKFPMTVYEPKENVIGMKIPTILTLSMSQQRNKYKPTYTFESFYYDLGAKEIIVE